MLKIARNQGKIFEDNFKSSIPKEILYVRPPDSAQSFGHNDVLRFSAKSPCDCFLFDGAYLYTLELKTVGSKSISFERDKEDKGIIHKHQIDSLVKFSKYKNVHSGFMLDFRLSDKTYYVPIEDFTFMIDKLDKKSFNEDDIVEYCNYIELKKKKLRVNYRYDIIDFINRLNEMEESHV